MKTYKNFCIYLSEKWSDKYKKSIDCNNPKGFSQRAHCQGKKKLKEDTSTINDQDLKDVSEWLDTSVDNIKVELKKEPISKFEKQIKEMYSTYDEFPKDEKRTNKILNQLKEGEKALPIYVEKNDKNLFVMEGRHRMVAFWLHEMKEIPVAYVSKKN